MFTLSKLASYVWTHPAIWCRVVAGDAVWKTRPSRTAGPWPVECNRGRILEEIWLRQLGCSCVWWSQPVDRFALCHVALIKRSIFQWYIYTSVQMIVWKHSEHILHHTSLKAPSYHHQCFWVQNQQYGPLLIEHRIFAYRKPEQLDERYNIAGVEFW